MRVLFFQGFVSPDLDYKASDAVGYGITSAEAIIEGLSALGVLHESAQKGDEPIAIGVDPLEELTLGLIYWHWHWHWHWGLPVCQEVHE